MGTDKEKASKVQDLLTLCLAKAIDTSLSAIRGRNWFQKFRDEEADKPPAQMIVRSHQNSIDDCDFQALLKLLYFRQEYCNEVLKFYGQESAITKGTRDSGFRRTLGRLINDYRNNIGAHVSVSMIRQNETGDTDGQFYSYPTALLDMKSIAYVFSSVTDESGESYFNQINAIMNGPSDTKSKKWVIVAAAAAAVVAIGAVLFFLKPWEMLGIGGSTVDQTLDMSNFEMTEQKAKSLAQEFYKILYEEAQAGDYESFQKHFAASYSDAQIQETYQSLGSSAFQNDGAEVFAYMNYGFAAFVKDGTEAMPLIVSRFPEGWKMGASPELDALIRKVLVDNNMDGLCKNQYYQADVQQHPELIEKAYAEAYCPLTYENATGNILRPDGYIRLGCITPNSSGGLQMSIYVYNGTSEPMKGLKLSSLALKDMDTDTVLMDLSDSIPAFENLSIPPNSSDSGSLTLTLTEGINMDHTIEIAYDGLEFLVDNGTTAVPAAGSAGAGITDTSVS